MKMAPIILFKNGNKLDNSSKTHDLTCIMSNLGQS